MTGYTVHTGSNEKFSQGWDRIFQKKNGPARRAPQAPASSKSKKIGSKKPPSPKQK